MAVAASPSRVHAGAGTITYGRARAVTAQKVRGAGWVLGLRAPWRRPGPGGLTASTRQGVHRRVRCCAAPTEVFRGKFGNWTVEREDRMEVFLYRLGLTTSASSAMALGAGAFLPGNDLLLNLGYLQGCLGFGLSLWYIHIYVTPLKRFLQALWAAGVAGSAFIGLAHGETSLPAYVASQPSAIWLCGPLFASVTGVAFKEGVCYGKPEAFALMVLTPVVCLCHLAGVDGKLQPGLYLIWALVFLVFAAGKYKQPVHEDIGDKSIFTFLKLSEDEQRAMLEASGESWD